MVKGIGNDIIEIERIEAVIARYGSRFLDKIFTASEQRYCSQYKNPIPHYAVRFAAKEAVSKALGTGFRHGLSWLDIEIRKNRDGKPEVYPSSKLKELLGPSSILVSLSHCRAYAMATAVWVDDQGG